MLEDIVEGFLWCNLTAGDFGKDIENVAEVFAEEVATDAVVESGYNTV